MKPCHICLGPCDPVFHASSRRILRWLVGGSVMVPPVLEPKSKGAFVARDVHGLRSPVAKRKTGK